MRIPAPPSAKPWLRQLRHLASRRWRSVLVVQDTPHRVAWGFAIGMFIGWLPIMGIQMVAAGLLAWVLRANVVASLPPVWISNPVTVVPMYYLCNRTGALFAGDPVSFSMIAAVLRRVHQLEWHQALRFVFGELFGAVIATCIGGVLLGLVTAIPCYLLVKMTVTTYQRIRMERRLRWLGIVEPPGTEPVDDEHGTTAAHRTDDA